MAEPLTDPNAVATTAQDVAAQVAAAPTISHELAQKLLGWLDSTQDFVAEQAPEVVQQLLQWAFYSNLFELLWGLMWLGIGLGFICFAARLYRKNREAHANYWSANHASYHEDNMELLRLFFCWVSYLSSAWSSL